MNKSQLFSSLSLALLIPLNTTAAERFFLQDKLQDYPVLKNSARSINQYKVSSLFGLSENNSFTIKRLYTDSDGTKTIRYQQLYKGIPIIGDDLIISRYSNGEFKLAHGAILNGIAADIGDITPKISLQKSLDIAKLYVNQKQLTSSRQNNIIYDNEKNQLAIWQDKSGKARLVYEVTFIQHAEHPSRPYLIIDAKTGKVLHYFDNLQTTQATGPGGNEKIGKYYYGTDYDYLEVTQQGTDCLMVNKNIRTIDLQNGTSGNQVYSFTCPDNPGTPSNGSYSVINDAHYFGGVVFDLYKSAINAPALNFQAKMRVNYSTNYANAFWDGTSLNFGSGGGNAFYSLVGLDITGHEMSHGFTEQNSGLVYSNQSGGLNESFSDMAGEAAENLMFGSNDWLVGAHISKTDNVLRYLDDPTKDGHSIAHQTDYIEGMDVHYSSGVYNKAFYILSNMNDWNIQKAFQVFARANQHYWTANTNWNLAGNGAIDSACDLGYSGENVQSALLAVGVISTSNNPECIWDGREKILENNQPVANLAAQKNESIIYRMTIPDNSRDIQFKISGGSGDADLYVKQGSKPTDSSYDCRPFKNGNEENCQFNQGSGEYYVRIKAYSEFNNLTLLGSYKDNTLPPVIDETIENINLDTGEWKYFPVTLSHSYNQLEILISGGSGDADLYLNHAAQPTLNQYECRPYKWGNNEKCIIQQPQEGTWYIGIRGYSDVQSLTLNYKTTL